MIKYADGREFVPFDVLMKDILRELELPQGSVRHPQERGCGCWGFTLEGAEESLEDLLKEIRKKKKGG